MTSSSSDDDESGWFSVAIMMIIAREVLEGMVIISNYRTLVNRSDMDQDKKNIAFRTIWIYAGAAAGVAVLINVVVAVILGILGNEVDKDPVRIIEGVSKVVAALCIAGLSLKIPKWLGLYQSRSSNKDIVEEELTPNRLRFDIAWNIWRETAEIGIFLVPSFLSGDLAALPLSAVVGLVLALFVGALLHFANTRMNNKIYLAVLMAGITGLLATGLFTGGCHEFEEVWGETDYVYKIKGDFWHNKKFPLAILKPFGYTPKPTVLMMCCFWIFGFLLVLVHFIKVYRSMSKNRLADSAAASGKHQMGNETEKGTKPNDS